MPITYDRVRPGDLITADHFNTLFTTFVDTINELESRIRILESDSDGEPAVGVIDVHHKNSPDGVLLVRGSTEYTHIFTIRNGTNRALNLLLNANVDELHGNWANQVQIVGPGSITLDKSASRDVTARIIKVPDDAITGERATLHITATAGPPHNLRGYGDLPMTISNTRGGPVNHSVQLVDVLAPVDTSNMGTDSKATYAFKLHYAASAPPMAANFNLKIKLIATPASALSEWGADFFGDNMTTSTGVFMTNFDLDAAAILPKTITFRVFTPITRGTEDKTVTFAALIESTDVPEIIPVESAQFTITVKKG